MEGAGDDVVLLLLGEGVELHRVAGDADGQLRVLLGVSLGVKQGLLGEDVDVEVVATLLDVAVDHADEVVDLLGRSLREGMTTAELDRIAFEFIKDCGAEPAFLGYCGYPASACISLDDMVVHGIPNDKQVIKEGVIVSIDVGAVKNGFVGDAARSFYVGDVNQEDISASYDNGILNISFPKAGKQIESKKNIDIK